MIYLDNAATTYPKPPAVARQMLRALTHYGGNPGRGAHALSLAAASAVYDCRCALSDFFGVGDPERILFTLNTTHALNLAIKGLVHAGDHVLISDMEHNAVLRPVAKLAQEGVITYDVFPTLTDSDRQNPTRICAAIARLVRPNTTLLVCTHASNVCSASFPIAQIASFCQKRGIYFVVDAAQSAGHFPIHLDEWGISALCAPSHKGLYGPCGCGILALGRGVRLQTLTEGGSGMQSLEVSMPEEPPERYEAGTLPTPAILGLQAGLQTVTQYGLEAIAHHTASLYERYAEILGNTRGIRLLAPRYRGAVLSFCHNTLASEALCRGLDGYGICVRGGYHCAALAHQTLQTAEGGATRLSFGIYNTFAETERFAKALAALLPP